MDALNSGRPIAESATCKPFPALRDASIPDVVPYEKRLSANSRWALNEASEFFEGRGTVQQALRKITARLNDLGIPYSIVGGLALFQHGYRRFTEDVDLLVTPENLKLIHEKFEGPGYVHPFKDSKQLRDTEFGAKIKFLTTGGFPGDGKPKPVSFPDPLKASSEIDGIRYLKLEPLIELKLASGMTSAGRMRDLADVIELIKVLQLPIEHAEQLNPYVREKYRELWRSAQSGMEDESQFWAEDPESGKEDGLESDGQS